MIRISRDDGGGGDRRLDVPSSFRSKKNKSRKTSREAPSSRPPRRTGRSLFGRLATFFFLAAFWGGVLMAALVGWYALDLPDIENLSAVERRPSITFLAEDGSVIATYGDLYGRPVQSEDLPPALVQAVLATEDRRFFTHFGIDLLGLGRAMWANVKSGRIVQGGSTITQQLAKNLFLNPERTLKRKVQEAILALWLEQRFSKEQILTIYLNRVYLGEGTYGIEAAAQKYFGHGARDLSVHESALIAGLLKAPSRYAPTKNPDLAHRRTAEVLSNMTEAGYLSAQDVESVAKEKLDVRAFRDVPRSSRYFIDWLLPQIPRHIGATNADLVVSTTLDLSLQEIAEDKFGVLAEEAATKLAAGQGALLTLSPQGAIKAMIGGRDYGDSQFNRATQAVRQPGSAFKLFVYLAALESGLTPDDTFFDTPIRISGWAPENYEGDYAGEVSLRTAFAQSINTVAVQVSEKIGREKVRAAARRLGISTALPEGPSVALGTGSVRLLDLTAAYAVVANGGEGVLPFGITEIKDAQGNLLYQRSGSGLGPLAEPPVLLALNTMLEAVVTEGTGKAARLKNRPAAGKTGTSQDSRDAWFVGYTADLVTGIWFGNDDDSPMAKVTGGNLPARLWGVFMESAESGKPVRPLLAGLREKAAVRAEEPAPGETAPGETVPGGTSAATTPFGAPPPKSSVSVKPGSGFWGDLMRQIGIED